MTDESTRADVIDRGALRFGWAAVAFYLSLGLVLEALHLVKAPLYVDATLRRELWTLAHAHGTLLGLINVAFAATAGHLTSPRAHAWAKRLLMLAAVFVPAGFFAGAIGNAEGDPSLFIILVPVGAISALAGVLLIATGRRRAVSDES